MDKNNDPPEAELDTVGAKYLKVVNSVSFYNVAIYTVEIQYPDTGGPKSRRPRTLKSTIYLTTMSSRRLKM